MLLVRVGSAAADRLDLIRLTVSVPAPEKVLAPKVAGRGGRPTATRRWCLRPGTGRGRDVPLVPITAGSGIPNTNAALDPSA